MHKNKNLLIRLNGIGDSRKLSRNLLSYFALKVNCVNLLDSAPDLALHYTQLIINVILLYIFGNASYGQIFFYGLPNSFTNELLLFSVTPFYRHVQKCVS